MLKASVIIPSYDRQIIVMDTLGHLNNQTETKFEVIVVDQTVKKSKNLALFQFKNSSILFKFSSLISFLTIISLSPDVNADALFLNPILNLSNMPIISLY